MNTDTKVQQNPQIQNPTKDSPQKTSGKFAQYEVSIANLSKPLVLICLLDYASEGGSAFTSDPAKPMVSTLMPKMSIKAADEYIEQSLSKTQRLQFDYVNFWQLRVNISGSTLMTKDYDSLYGTGAAEKAIEIARILTEKEKDPKNNLEELRTEYQKFRL